MSHDHRIYLAGAPAADVAEASGPSTSFMVEGVVLEVLAGYGLVGPSFKAWLHLDHLCLRRSVTT